MNLAKMAERVLSTGGITLDAKAHPDEDEALARDLQDAAGRLEYQARQLQAQAAFKRTQARFGMCPDEWLGHRTTSAVPK